MGSRPVVDGPVPAPGVAGIAGERAALGGTAGGAAPGGRPRGAPVGELGARCFGVGRNCRVVQGFSCILHRVLLDSRQYGPTIAPLFRAGIAQLVERNLAKVEVASSSLVSRSKIFLARINS